MPAAPCKISGPTGHRTPGSSAPPPGWTGGVMPPKHTLTLPFRSEDERDPALRVEERSDYRRRTSSSTVFRWRAAMYASCRVDSRTLSNARRTPISRAVRSSSSARSLMASTDRNASAFRSSRSDLTLQPAGVRPTTPCHGRNGAVGTSRRAATGSGLKLEPTRDRRRHRVRELLGAGRVRPGIQPGRRHVRAGLDREVRERSEPSRRRPDGGGGHLRRRGVITYRPMPT